MTNRIQSLGFLFPGQGAQAVGMGKELAETFPLAAEVFEQADQILGFPLSKMAWEGPAEELNDTANTQPALYVHSIAVWKVLKDRHPEVQPKYMAGHSLGEFSALTAAGSFSFAQGLLLVRARGERMREAGVKSPGRIAAILGLTLDQLEEITAEAAAEGQPVTIANDNCPGQVVISGSQDAVDRAIELAKAAGAKRALPLKVSVAVHSSLMADAQQGLMEAINNTEINAPQVPVIGNVSALPLKTAEDVRQELQAQLTSRVRWTETIEYLIENGITRYYELGSGKVLSGLTRRIDRGTSQIALGKPEDFESLTT
ncbi:MAG: ACP S-malonyltransferase [Chloroflexota bacterium]